jgi:hypothetical protein
MGVRIYPIAKTTELSFWNKALGLNVTAEALAKHEAVLQAIDNDFDAYDKEVDENPDCYTIYGRKLNGFGKGYDGLYELVQVESYCGSVRENQTAEKAEEIIERFASHCRFVLGLNVDVSDVKDIQWG